jgi:hypothetical protein
MNRVSRCVLDLLSELIDDLDDTILSSVASLSDYTRELLVECPEYRKSECFDVVFDLGFNSIQWTPILSELVSQKHGSSDDEDEEEEEEEDDGEPSAAARLVEALAKTH